MAEGGETRAGAGGVASRIWLLDVNLPDLDGAEVYRRLRSPETWKTHVLFLTAATSLDLYQRGIEAGVVLRKPFEMRDLVSLVRTLVASSRCNLAAPVSFTFRVARHLCIAKSHIVARLTVGSSHTILLVE